MQHLFFFKFQVYKKKALLSPWNHQKFGPVLGWPELENKIGGRGGILPWQWKKLQTFLFYVFIVYLLLLLLF